MRGLLNFLMLFLQNYLPIKTVVYLNIIQGEDLTLFSHIDTERHKQRMYSWRRKSQGTDAFLKMLPEPGICPHSARKTGWQWWWDISKLKESCYSPFCVANGSRKQVDKNDSVTLGLLSINTTSAWITTSSWMLGSWRRHPSSPPAPSDPTPSAGHPASGACLRPGSDRADVPVALPGLWECPGGLFQLILVQESCM